MARPGDVMEKMQARQNFRNIWHTNLQNTITVDCPYCCFAFWCAPCASYLLRKRALYDDMSRYTCCAGFMPCSGRCGESKCPEFCLCTETQHKVELDKRDGKFGPMQPPPAQHMSRIDQAVPPPVGYTPNYGGAPTYDQPKPTYPQPYGYPPQAYPASGYLPQGYPPQAGGGYSPSGYPHQQ